MFLGDEGYFTGRPPHRPEPPRHPGETLLSRLLLGFGFVMLFLPISADGLIDLIRYLFG